MEYSVLVVKGKNDPYQRHIVERLGPAYILHVSFHYPHFGGEKVSKVARDFLWGGLGEEFKYFILRIGI